MKTKTNEYTVQLFSMVKPQGKKENSCAKPILNTDVSNEIFFLPYN